MKMLGGAPCHAIFSVHFMLHVKEDRRKLERFIRSSLRMPQNRQALAKVADAHGQALVEFALMVPFLFLLIFNAVIFGGFIYDWITVSNAARVGAQYAAIGAAYASYPSTASLAAIKSMIQGETSSLPGASSTNPAVTVCQSDNGTNRCGHRFCSATTLPSLSRYSSNGSPKTRRASGRSPISFANPATYQQFRKIIGPSPFSRGNSIDDVIPII